MLLELAFLNRVTVKLDHVNFEGGCECFSAYVYTRIYSQPSTHTQPLLKGTTEPRNRKKTKMAAEILETIEQMLESHKPEVLVFADLNPSVAAEIDRKSVV